MQIERLEKLKKLRDELIPDFGSESDFNRGYFEALDLVIRIIEDKHSIIDCCNMRCSSPVPPWHCYECEELDIDYDADHIKEYLNESS